MQRTIPFDVAMILIFWVIACAIVAVLLTGSFRRKRWRWPNGSRQPDLADVGQQLNAVMAGAFQKRRILSSSEYRVFTIIEAEIKAHRPGYRVFAQTSLGEILRSNDDHAFRSVNSKRVDVLVVDRGGWPTLAVEFQGDGHYQGTAAGRDAVKKEALRKAGVRYMECFATDSDDQVRSRLREHIGIQLPVSNKTAPPSSPIVQGPWSAQTRQQ